MTANTRNTDLVLEADVLAALSELGEEWSPRRHIADVVNIGGPHAGAVLWDLLDAGLAERRDAVDDAGEWRLSPQLAVIEGPAGHWVALHDGEVLGRAMAVADDRAPAHPAVDDDGWGALEDLGDADRLAALEEIERAAEEASR